MKTFRVRLAGVVAASMIAGACTGSFVRDANDRAATDRLADAAVVAIPPPASVAPTTHDEPRRGTSVSIPRPRSEAAEAALIDTDGRLALVQDGTVRDDWIKFVAHPSPDGTAAVLELHRAASGLTERPVMWADLPSGESTGEQYIAPDLELTALSLDGTVAGFTTLPSHEVEGAIAGSRETSRITVVDRDHGVVFEQDLDGNFEPEAFSSRTDASGVPTLVFLLEYFPAEEPRFYRVRVLSTETGEVSLPLDLRNKQQQVDERMAGFTRSQVVAGEHGLLFTLYRGTIDGTPDGEPYAFVHTLDFADGVWCLEVDPRLELDRFAGSLAVGGDRLYVASANGMVGAYAIPSITDPNLSPTMGWVADTGSPAERPPVVTADDESVYVVDDLRPGFMNRVSPDGDLLAPTRFDGLADAVAWRDGGLHAVGDGWATFDVGRRPGWLGEIAYLVVD